MVHMREEKGERDSIRSFIYHQSGSILLIQDSVSVLTLVGWSLLIPILVDLSFFRAIGTYGICFGRCPRFLVIWSHGSRRPFALRVSSFAVVWVRGTVGGTRCWSKGKEILTLGKRPDGFSSLLSQPFSQGVRTTLP